MQNYTWLFCATQNMKKIAMMVCRNLQNQFQIFKISIQINKKEKNVSFPHQNCGFTFFLTYSSSTV